jgi:AcrR family transcriptional regulator
MARRTLIRRADRRAAIVGSAIALIDTNGPGVTISEIADAAGTSESVIFYAFTDRAELLGACIDALMADADVLDRMSQAVNQRTIRRRLIVATTALRDNMVRVVPIMLATMRSPSLGPGPQLAGVSPLEDRLATVLATERGWAAPVDELVGNLMGLFFGQVFQHVTYARPLPPIERTIDMFLNGTRRPT